MKRFLISALALTVLLAPAAALAQEAPGAVGRARAAAVHAAKLANDTAQAAEEGDGKATGLERAQQAVTAAMERGNGNGRGLGRGNATNVLAAVAAGGPVANGNTHGKAVSAAAHALKELSGNNGNGNGWGRGGNPNKGDDDS